MRLPLALLGVLTALILPAAALGDASVLVSDTNATADSTGAVISVSPAGVQKALATNALSGAAGGEQTFSQPYDLTVSPGGVIYVLDSQSSDTNPRISAIDPATGKERTVSTNAISAGAGGQSQFFSPTGILVGSDGFLYVTDAGRGIIKVNPATGAQTLVVSNAISTGQGGEAAFHQPYRSVQLANGDFATADSGSSALANDQAVVESTPSGKETTLSDDSKSVAAGGAAVFGAPHGITRGPDGVLYVTDGNGAGSSVVNRVESSGKATTLATGGPLINPFGIDYASDGNLYVADYGSAGSGSAVLRISPTTGQVTTVSTNASSAAAGGAALFNTPIGISAAGLPAAAPPRAPAAAKPQCANGKDDDNDGAIDLKDPGCSSASDNNEGDESASDLVLCGRRKISLVRADAKGRKVVLSGIVAAQLAGKKVKVIQVLKGKRTTLATVKPSKTGAFSAKVKRPSARAFAKARYLAQVGSSKSTALKLPQSLASSSIRKVGSKLELKGNVKRSLLGKRKPIVIRRIVCGRYKTVATVKPSRSGAYTARFAVPTGAAALYRAEGQVLARPGSKKYVKQYARALSITLTSQTG